MKIWEDNPTSKYEKSHLQYIEQLANSQLERAIEHAEYCRGFIGLVKGGQTEYERACVTVTDFKKQLSNIQEALKRRFPDSEDEEPAKEQKLITKRRGRKTGG